MTTSMNQTVDLTGIPNEDEDTLSDAGSEVCEDCPDVMLTEDHHEDSSSSEEETDSELLSDLDERYETTH